MVTVVVVVVGVGGAGMLGLWQHTYKCFYSYLSRNIDGNGI